MYDRLIVASGDESSLAGWRGIAELLKLELAPGARVTDCLDTDELKLVWEQGPGDRDLIIAETELPAGRRSRDGASDTAALDLIETLQRSDTPPACILIGPGQIKTYDRIIAWPRCRFLALTQPSQQDCIKSLRAFAAELARADKAKREVAGEEWALIDVNIGAGSSSVTLHTGRGNESFPEAPEPLHLDKKKLEKVIARSRHLRKEFSERLADPARREEQLIHWQKEYEAVGAQVFELLSATPFIPSWVETKGLKSSRRRLRFTLSGNAYDAMWEAIRIPWAKTHPWLMLESTIARRVRADFSPDVRQLDGGDGCVNVLVILADCGEGSSLEGPEDDGWRAVYRQLVDEARRRSGIEPESASDLFPPLENLTDELRALKRLEGPAGERKARLSVDVLRSDGETAVPLWEQVRDALTEGPIPQGRRYRYDVVHFAGHALFAEGVEQSGYLIFGDVGESRAVSIAEFADWLRVADVQLAYLSCCRSSASRAALELAYTGVPLAIGFAWDLETRMAVKFAEKFYSHLLKTDLKVCQAFHKARYELHRHHQERDSIWAAPVLVAQPERWEKVETCFTRGQPIH